MADDISHDGGSPGMEGDPEHVLLPSRVRPFDLEAYHPKRDSHSILGYGTTFAREWYMDLPISFRQIINEAGFGLFCTGLSRLIVSRALLGALVERWWDTTNFFHFSTAGDMTMTLYDFVMLTGIELWVYAYFPTLAPEPEVEMPPIVLLVLRVLPVTGLCLRDHGSYATSTIHEGYRDSKYPFDEQGSSSEGQGQGGAPK
ncbi:hypothetical protein CsSME_00032489 [Camellia sinensis var. sinensis]